MENYSRHENAGFNDLRRTALVGLGNPLHGDDAVGLIVAQSVFPILRHELSVDLLKWPILDARLAERLIGYHRAVIVDSLVDTRAEVGTVQRVEIAKHSGNPTLSLHTTGFQNLVALARLVGMIIPRRIQIYGIVIRESADFYEGLSSELRAQIPDIVIDIAAEELRGARKVGRAKALRASRTTRNEGFAENG